MISIINKDLEKVMPCCEKNVKNTNNRFGCLKLKNTLVKIDN